MLHYTIKLNLTSPINSQYFRGTVVNYNKFYKSNTETIHTITIHLK